MSMTNVDDYRIWTDHEVAFLLRERSVPRGKRRRMTVPQIAARLERSFQSVSSKLKFLKKPKVKVLPASPRPVVETMAVGKELVCDLYESGWRFDGFSSEGLCIMRKERRL